MHPEGDEKTICNIHQCLLRAKNEIKTKKN